jgi:glycosyltransferase involved in cell wall biosynthesis
VTARRVAFVVRASRGGMTRHVLDLVAGLPRDRWEPVGVLAPADPRMEAGLRALGVRFLPVPMADGVSLLADDRTSAALVGGLSGLDVDVLHLHSNKAAHVGIRAVSGLDALAKAGRIAKKPAVVFTAHNVPSFEASGWLRRMAGRRALRNVGRRVDRTIAVSAYLRDRLVSDIGFDPAKVAVVHNGVDAAAIGAAVAASDRAATRDAAGIPADAFVIGTLGRLVESKGIEVLLSAFARLSKDRPSLRCVVVGDGPAEAALKKTAAELRIQTRVAFPGFVEDPIAWLAAMDLFVLPTLQESFGLAALEAMAAGLPVVASATGGVPEVVDDGRTGVLVPPGRLDDLTAAIAGLIDDPKSRGALGGNAREAAAARFGLPAMAAATADVYDAAAAAGS